MVIRSLTPHRPARAVRPYWGLRGGFEDLFDGFWGDLPAQAEFAPRVDVEEDEKEVRVVAELPGVEEKDFEVLFEDGVLTIKGEKRSEHEEKREGYRHLERASGSFSRSFRIPWDVDPESIKAAHKNGVVTISVPKPAEKRPEPRAIPIHKA